MKRLTINDLKDTVNTRNSFLVHSGSNVFFKAKERNGYKAVDLYFIDNNGLEVCQGNTEAGTPRECIERLYIEASNNMGKRYHGSEITRKTAKGRLLGHIDFNKDPAQLSQCELELLHTWAKITNYKKPVNFSRGYGFYIHLQKRVKL